jgi:hypothetical protein
MLEGFKASRVSGLVVMVRSEGSKSSVWYRMCLLVRVEAAGVDLFVQVDSQVGDTQNGPSDICRIGKEGKASRLGIRRMGLAIFVGLVRKVRLEGWGYAEWARHS